MEVEIEKLRSANGGFKRADLERHGIPWPPPKGWLSRLKRGLPALTEGQAAASRERQTIRLAEEAAKRLRKKERRKARKARRAAEGLVRPKRIPRATLRVRAVSPEQYTFIIGDAFLDSFEWRRLRYQALKRSDGLCELCGRGKVHGIVLNVDHIKCRRTHPELALVLENTQVLCGPCNHGKCNHDDTNWRLKNAERSGQLADADAAIPWDRLEAF